jgi:hypothetical protein
VTAKANAHFCAQCAVTTLHANIMGFEPAKAAKDFSSGQFKRMQSMFVWPTRTVQLINGDETGASFAGFKSVSLLAWSKRWCELMG